FFKEHLAFPVAQSSEFQNANARAGQGLPFALARLFRHMARSGLGAACSNCIQQALTSPASAPG
ncbi:MAG: hypothetical protein DMF39_01730, partial [Verrucomicrobia bacterium]